MDKSIQTALSDLEATHEVRVLFACESGSRAWGFASPDSDYDVRFIYVRPRDWYLSIEERRDVIEAMLPGDLDLAGWDLRKALGLLKKSNPALIEWLRSPIVYKSDPEFVREFTLLTERWASPDRLFRHYASMALSNWNSYLQGEEINLKKYLYVLRPVMACRWVEERRTPPPVAFAELLDASDLNSSVREAIDGLLERKRVASEGHQGPPIAALQEFLDSEIIRSSGVSIVSREDPDPEELNLFFRAWLEI